MESDPCFAPPQDQPGHVALQNEEIWPESARPEFSPLTQSSPVKKGSVLELVAAARSHVLNRQAGWSWRSSPATRQTAHPSAVPPYIASPNFLLRGQVRSCELPAPNS